MDTDEFRAIRRKPLPPLRSAYYCLPQTPSEQTSDTNSTSQSPRAQEPTKWLPVSRKSLYQQVPVASGDEQQATSKHISNSDDEKGSYRQKSRLAGPLSWTHPIVLLAFVATFACTLAAVVILHHLSQRENGFNIGRSTGSYTWKYGPTAVLTVVIALWRQVDIATKSTPHGLL